MTAIQTAHPAPTQPPTAPKRWHPWRWLGVSLLGGLILFLALILWLITTQSGLRVVAKLAERALPETLELGAVTGRLIDQITLHDLRLRLPTLELEAGQLDLAWQPARLLDGTLSVTQLRGHQLELLTIPSDKPQEPLRLPQIALPLNIEVEQLRIEQLRLAARATPETPLLVLTEAELAAALSGSELTLHQFQADFTTPKLQAQADGRLELRDAYPLDVHLDWNFSQAPALQLTGQGQATGDLRQLRIEHRISGSATVTLEAHLRELLEQPQWTAQMQLTGADLPSLIADAPPVAVSAQLASAGHLNQANLTGTLKAAAPDFSDFGQLAAELDLNWHNRQLSIVALKLIEPESGAKLDVHGQVDLAHPQGQVDLSGVWEALRWPLTGAARFGSPRGSLDVTGQLDDFNYNLDAEVFGHGLPETGVALRGDGNQQGTRIGELRVDSLGGQVMGKGTLSWTPELAWDLALTARELDPGRQWAGLAGTVGLKAESQGNLKRGYDYQLKANVALRDYPSVVANVTGTGSASALDITGLDLATLGGRITGTGQLDWAQELAWAAQLNLSELDPGHYQADWAGSLGGTLATQGHLPTTGPELELRIRDFGGQLRGYPVQATAWVDLHGEALTIHELQLRSGATALNAHGQAGETLAVDFTVQSPDLGELLPQAHGRLKIEGRGQGARQAPQLRLTLQGRDLELQGQGIATLEGQVDLGLGTDGPLQVNLVGQNLLAGGMRFDQLELRSQGTLAAHRLTGRLSGEALSATLALAGQQPTAGVYRGELNRLELDTANFGRWRLRQAMPMVMEQEQIDLGPLCITNDQNSGGCVQWRQIQAGVFDAKLDLPQLDLALFDHLLPPTLDLQGVATATAALKTHHAQLVGTAQLRLPQGELELTLPNTNNRLVFSGTKLDLSANAQGAQASVAVPVEDFGTFNAQVRLPGFALHAPDIEHQRLDGELRLDVRDFSRLGQLVPDISDATGTLTAAIDLSGTLGTPRLEGQARLGPLSFQAPLIGLRVADAQLQAHLRGGDRLELTGGADIGGGQLTLSGDGERQDSGWTFAVQLAGKQLKVADSKEYFALIGTDLRGGLGPDGVFVRGGVEVEQARLMPRAIPAGTVSNAADVVVEGQQHQTSEAQPLNADVEIRLSDEVLLEAFGLRAHLRGRLRALAEPGQPLLGDGQLEVLDGTYRLSSQFGLMASVGAPLKIAQGILVFAKTPLDNPGLVLSAQREGGDMTAGVRVLGTLKKPKLAFFSESDPNMNDAEIVNYLLTGVPPKGNASDVDQSLSVGTYVTPKLFLEYESNLGDQADKVKLRYDFNRWIEFQTETGQAQGADLFFKFEN